MPDPSSKYGTIELSCIIVGSIRGGVVASADANVMHPREVVAIPKTIDAICVPSIGISTPERSAPDGA